MHVYSTLPHSPSRRKGTGAITEEDVEWLQNRFRYVNNADLAIAEAARADISNFLDTSGFADHVFNYTIQQMRAISHLKPEEFNLVVDSVINPEYKSRVATSIFSPEVAERIAFVQEDVSGRAAPLKKPAAVKSVLRDLLHNITLSVANSHRDDLQLTEKIWDTNWGKQPVSLSEAVSSGGESATSIEDTTAGPAAENPSVAYENVLVGGYPEYVSVFLPDIMANASAAIPKGSSVTPDSARAAAQKAVQEHTDFRQSLLDAAGGDDENFMDVAYFREFSDRISQDIANAILAVRKEHQAEPS